MRITDYCRLFLLAALWGASFLFMRIAVPQFGAINTAFLRVLFGLAGLTVILLLSKSSFNFRGKLLAALLLGAINSGIPFLMYCLAARWLPTGYSAILNATTPLMGAVIGLLLFNEPLNRRKWAGVILGVVGILMIIRAGEIQTASGTLAGIIACLVATGCYGLAGFLTRRWITAKGSPDPKLVAFGSQLGASLILLPFFAGSLNIDAAANWSDTGAWFSVVAVGLLCTALAYILYFRLITDIGPLRSLTVTFLIPPFAVLWGYLILGETINRGFLPGAVIICLAVWMVVSQSLPVVRTGSQ